MKLLRFGIVAGLAFLLVGSSNSYAGSIIPVSSGEGTHTDPISIVASDGGQIIVWQRELSAGSFSLLAKKLDASGFPPREWNTEIEIVNIPSYANPFSYSVISDQAGGAIVAWLSVVYNYDEGSDSPFVYEYRAQRITSTGSLKWSTDNSDQTFLMQVADFNQFYFQWTAPGLVSDGAGGAIVAWNHWDTGYKKTISLQRISAKGEHLWKMQDTGGLLTLPLPSGETEAWVPRLVSDGAHGAVMEYSACIGCFSVLFASSPKQAGKIKATDHLMQRTRNRIRAGRMDGENRLMAQRIGADGTLQWSPAEGIVAATNHIASELDVDFETDGSGGGLLAYTQIGDDGKFMIINAQHLDGGGNLLWGNGIPLTDSKYYSDRAKISGDGQGGAVVMAVQICCNIWEGTMGTFGLFAQRLNSKGEPQWGESGGGRTVISGVVNELEDSFVGDGAGGMVLTWGTTLQGAAYEHLWAQRVNPDGTLRAGVGGMQVSDSYWYLQNRYSNVAMDSSGNAFIAWSSFEGKIFARKIASDVMYGTAKGWNLVSVPVAIDGNAPLGTIFPSALSHAYVYDGGYRSTDALSNGIGYWVKFPETPDPVSGNSISSVTVDVRKGWNLIGSIGTSMDYYSITSDPAGMTLSFAYYFSPEAQQYERVENFLQPGFGYWVKADQAGQLTLSASASPAATNRVRIVPSSDLPPAFSPPGGKSATQKPTETTLAQNFPNPFNPSTTIGYQVAVSGPVKLTLFNALGQQVRTLVDQAQEPGSYTVQLDAKGLPSGTYFYRLQAGNATSYKKMILTK